MTPNMIDEDLKYEYMEKRWKEALKNPRIRRDIKMILERDKKWKRRREESERIRANIPEGQ